MGPLGSDQRGHGATRVEAVTLRQGGSLPFHGGGFTAEVSLQGPALGPDIEVGHKIDLQVRVGEHDGAEIAPLRAHDGQFLLEDLIWPGLPHVLLPEVDHAQPVLGGAGFDAARYWMTLLAVLLEPAAAAPRAA